jgi:hypothetical protein
MRLMIDTADFYALTSVPSPEGTDLGPKLVTYQVCAYHLTGNKRKPRAVHVWAWARGRQRHTFSVFLSVNKYRRS